MSGPFKHILVPIDFSESSEKAMDAVLHSFSGYDKVTALSVYEGSQKKSSHYDYDCELDVAMKKSATVAMTRFEQDYQKEGLELNTLVIKGNPATEIIAQAKNLKADLIVMGSQGRNSLASVFFGGTTYQVSRKAECSVLVIR